VTHSPASRACQVPPDLVTSCSFSHVPLDLTGVGLRAAAQDHPGEQLPEPRLSRPLLSLRPQRRAQHRHHVHPGSRAGPPASSGSRGGPLRRPGRTAARTCPQDSRAVTAGFGTKNYPEARECRSGVVKYWTVGKVFGKAGNHLVVVLRLHRRTACKLLYLSLQPAAVQCGSRFTQGHSQFPRVLSVRENKIISTRRCERAMRAMPRYQAVNPCASNLIFPVGARS
jgi:hypothetical protein